MANIQPYQYQKRTNIEEHNDLVSKINEIIDVINQTNIETILPKINKLETDVNEINDTDNVQNTDISNLKEKDVQIDNRLTFNENNIDAITKSLVSDVVLMNGTTTGNMKVRIERKNAPSIDSNDYNIQKPVSVELVQGSASAMVKVKITLSDGTVLISDDFMFTSDAIGTDVYISSFTFKNGNVAGSISADIGLSNGSTLEANNFVVPTDPNVTFAITDLQNRVSAVESGVTNLTTNKADVNNSNQTIVAGTVNATNINKGSVAVATVNDISKKVNIAQGVENAGKVLGINASGNVEPVTVESGGEVWEEVDLSNFPTDWVGGDRIKFVHTLQFTGSATSWTSQPSISGENPLSNGGKSKEIFEITIPEAGTNKTRSLIWLEPKVDYIDLICISTIYGYSAWNGNSGFMSVEGTVFNGNGAVQKSLLINRSNVSTYFSKMWRIKK